MEAQHHPGENSDRLDAADDQGMRPMSAVEQSGQNLTVSLERVGEMLVNPLFAHKVLLNSEITLPEFLLRQVR